MTKFERELQVLKPNDTIQCSEICRFTGYQFIYTASHGYLVIPRNDKQGMELVNNIDVAFGYKGKLAVYLEEDCEYTEFYKQYLKKGLVLCC